MRHFQLLLNYEEGCYCLATVAEIPQESSEIFMGLVKVEAEKIIFIPGPKLFFPQSLRDTFDVMATNLVRRREEENKRLRSPK